MPQVQVDNDVVRVTRWTLARGESTGLHRHQHDYVVVPLADAQMSITAADGSVTTSVLRGGAAYYRDAGAEHSVANERDEPVDFVEVEVRAQRAANRHRFTSEQVVRRAKPVLPWRRAGLPPAPTWIRRLLRLS